MTALPKLTPRQTPISAPAFSRNIPLTTGGTPKMTALHVTYPPLERAYTTDFAKMPERINQLAPAEGRRRINMNTETAEANYLNEQRKLLMQRREHYRYYKAWSRPYYGTPQEKEEYRKETRSMLKQQMDHKWSAEKQEFLEKVKESQAAAAYDQKCNNEDVENFRNRFLYLTKFRDENKRLMEKFWLERERSKIFEDTYDREQLRYNPINWSCTLK
ncbi:uncharacterized protein LOC106161884 [Lingula anatina]|uniref:Uncharacterized protein LOC106160990 n=1 Tax=Lingula anatina TaxID=7574 RepID=A0A1S3I4W2_LINAN|nr:uncharacterized protein LOC106160990 [Lingula anatina]XP_013394411.1 uncharacterized protein LOC106161884 [Lingula anatina]|eukprot:XP_013393263.1 uncharacterized protein LOC106160990 [Lingula anatina]